MSARRLIDLFNEGPLALLVREADDSASHETGGSGTSLDAQVDRYLAQYEGGARKEQVDVAQMEALDWSDLVRGHLLEAGEANKDDDEGDEAPKAADGAPTKLTSSDLDVEKFANSVARLVENYESLLEVRSTLVRRARAFLAKTYDDGVLSAFDDTMRDDHGVEPGRSAADTAADRFTAPAADRANGSAAPGGGGAPT